MSNLDTIASIMSTVVLAASEVCAVYIIALILRLEKPTFRKSVQSVPLFLPIIFGAVTPWFPDRGYSILLSLS